MKGPKESFGMSHTFPIRMMVMISWVRIYVKVHTIDECSSLYANHISINIMHIP